jgi:hypothetical protein
MDLAELRAQERVNQEVRAKYLRRSRINQANETTKRIREASAKTASPEVASSIQKSPYQLEWEAQEQERQKQASSAALDRLMEEQEMKKRKYYDKVKPAEEARDYAKQLEEAGFEHEPKTSNLEAFSLDSFDPTTKEFSGITYYNLEIMEKPPLTVKNSHVREAANGKEEVLVAAMKPRQYLGSASHAKRSSTKQKLVNIQNGIPKFGGGTPNELIILPFRLARKHYKDKSIAATEVNDIVLKGAKEISSSDSTISAIISAHGKDNRLVHPAREVTTNTIVNSSAKLDTEDPREVQEFAISKACDIPSCAFCYSEAEVKTIPNFEEQQKTLGFV